MHRPPGWRSQRSANALGAPLERGRQAKPSGPSRSRLAAVGDYVAQTVYGFRTIEWTIAFVGFLAYVFVIITYRFPVGRISMIVALLGLLLLRQKLRFTPFMIWFGLFWIWAALALVWAPWEGSRFEGFYREEMTQQVVDLAKVWLIAFVAVNVLRSRSQARFFMVFFLACFAMYPAKGTIFNYFSGNMRFGRAAWGDFIFGNPNAMASLSILPLGMAAALLPVDRNKLIRLGAIGTIVVLPVVILFTQSRAGFIGMATFGAFALAGRISIKRLIPLVLVVVLGILYAPQGVWDRMGGLVQTRDVSELSELEDSGSAEARWTIWLVATRIIKDHPVTGVGIGAYKYVHSDYAQPMRGVVLWAARGWRDTHSTYLNVTAETGIPGLILLLGTVGVSLYSAERMRRRARRTLPNYARQLFLLEAAVVAYLTAGLFGTYHKFPFLYLHLSLIWALILLMKKDLAVARSLVRAPAPPSGQP